MGISSVHNGKKIKPSPTVTMGQRVPSVKMPLGLEWQAAYVALALQLIPEGLRPATVRDWKQGLCQSPDAKACASLPCPEAADAPLHVLEGKIPRILLPWPAADNTEENVTECNNRRIYLQRVSNAGGWGAGFTSCRENALFWDQRTSIGLPTKPVCLSTLPVPVFFVHACRSVCVHACICVYVCTHTHVCMCVPVFACSSSL